MLVVHDSHVILIAKKSSIDSLLNYRVAVRIMTFSAIPSFLSNIK
jgi:hypothetical protein